MKYMYYNNKVVRIRNESSDVWSNNDHAGINDVVVAVEWKVMSKSSFLKCPKASFEREMQSVFVDGL